MVKIAPLSNIFTNIASSKVGQKFFTNVLNPKNDAFWNQTLPIIETSAATVAYIINTQVQKDIDEKSKKALQIQNILSWVISLGISMPLNKKLGKVTNDISKNLKPELIKDFEKVRQGLGTFAPLTLVTVLNRAIIPSVLVPISSVIRDKHDQKKKNKSINFKV